MYNKNNEEGMIKLIMSIFTTHYINLLSSQNLYINTSVMSK
jgi:hypothetical protein